MADNGIADIFIANEIVSDKMKVQSVAVKNAEW
ncbi:MAG: hypothetical protein FD169_1032 [Bacillota bacterium]|nr:MAG: hypothetical protein FD169_1032 [Bacillota bacterium]